MLGAVLREFPGSRAYDLRASPRYGYRALHAVISLARRGWVELQIRTSLQDTWANLSEQAADQLGMEVKYGGGPAELREQLRIAADVLYELDQQEERSIQWRQEISSLKQALETDGSLSKEWVMGQIDVLAAEAAAGREFMMEVDVKLRAFEVVYTRMVLGKDS